MQRILDGLEKGIVILGLVFFAGSFLRIWPSFSVTLIRYGILLVAIIGIALRFQHALYIANRDKILWLLIVVSFASFLWSDYPDYSYARCLDLLRMSIFGLYMATRFNLDEQIKLITASFGIIALLSTYYSVAVPSVGVVGAAYAAGAWKGIFSDKNTFGGLMALSMVAFYALWSDRSRSVRRIAFVGVAVSIAMVVLSTSKTALVVAFLVMITAFLYQRYRWKGERTVITLSLAILVFGFIAMMVLGNWEPLLSGLGRDPTLTGRTIIWSGALEQLQHHLWLGFGREAFWAPGSEYALEIGKQFSLMLGFIPPHAHNGYIEIALDTGLIGLVLFGISWFWAFLRAFKLAYHATGSGMLWPLCFLIMVTLYNVTESFLMRNANLYWVLYVAVVLSMPTIQQLSHEASRPLESLSTKPVVSASAKLNPYG